MGNVTPRGQKPQDLRPRTAHKIVLEIVTNSAFLMVMHPIVHPPPNRIDPSEGLNAIMAAAPCGLLTRMNMRNGSMSEDQCPQSHKHWGRPSPNALHRWQFTTPDHILRS